MSDARRLKALEDETSNLARLDADAMLEWTGKTCVTWHFIAPGKPMPKRNLRGAQRPDAG